MTDREIEDATIAAADEIYAAVEAHAERIGVVPCEVLHLVVMTWIDKLADQRLARRNDPRIEHITNAMANISGEAKARAERRV
jgi:hypothetical protein